MERTLLQILPLAIAATFSPTGLLFVTMILSGKKRPERNSLLFLVGSVIFLILLGSIIMLTFKPAVDSARHPDTLSGAIDIVLGGLVIVIIGRSLLFKSKEKTESKKTRKRPYVVLGFLYMGINGSTLIPFIAASKIIADAGLWFGDSLLLFIILILITMLMVSFPVMVTILMPAKSDKVMAPVKSFMSRHGGQIARIYFLLMGFYLIFHGIREIQGA